MCSNYAGAAAEPLNPDTMAAAISLSNIRCVAGQTEEALDLAAATAEDYPAVYGADHPYNYGCMGNLAMLRRLTGDLAEARRLNETALAGLDARLTRDHLFSLTVAVNLASDLAALGETAQARALGEDCLTRLTRLLGGQHPVTLGCAANLIIDLRADGADEEADALSAETMSGYERVLGPDHPMTEAGRRADADQLGLRPASDLTGALASGRDGPVVPFPAGQMAPGLTERERARRGRNRFALPGGDRLGHALNEIQASRRELAGLTAGCR